MSEYKNTIETPWEDRLKGEKKHQDSQTVEWLYKTKDKEWSKYFDIGNYWAEIIIEELPDEFKIYVQRISKKDLLETSGFITAKHIDLNAAKEWGEKAATLLEEIP